MKSVLLCLHLFLGILAESGWGQTPMQIGIVPQPSRVEPRKGMFKISPKTKIVYFMSNEEIKFAAEYLASRLRTATGFPLPIVDAATLPASDFIFLNFTRDEERGAEGYSLEVSSQRIDLEANNATGFFYAIQTLLQLLPPEVYHRQPVKGIRWIVPAVFVYDKPRFQWRGMHLDVSRHFFPKEFIYTYIDMLAMHKMNVFHWHLTDDQGWRLEIKKYPRLTEVAAWRVNHEDQLWNYRTPATPGEPATYGGFYTQEDVRSIVQYAADRNITVVPEIEMPAHATAALAAYPQFSCTGGPFLVPPGGVWPITDIFCAGNDSTFAFLQDVLQEVIDLFPSHYIHVGGDEADKKEWKVCAKCQARIKREGLKDETELQSYFVRRIEKYLISKDRRLIGWDEILEGGLAPEATVMSWRGTQGGIDAARLNHDVVMTPGSHCYFDHYQGKADSEPLAIGGYTPLSKVYEYEPVPEELTPDQTKRVLGAQANVWTEYIPTPEHAQYMTLPRMSAMAEVVWSAKELRDWKSFAGRIPQQLKRYEAAGYNFARSAFAVAITAKPDSVRRSVWLELAAELKTGDIRYAVGSDKPVFPSRVYTKPIEIKKSGSVAASQFLAGKRIGSPTQQTVAVHRASFRSVALSDPYERYTGGGANALTNCLRGSTSFNDGNWQGFRQKDLDAVIDLGSVRAIKKISVGFLESTGPRIFPPQRVEFFTSIDGIQYDTLKSFGSTQPQLIRPPQLLEVAAKGLKGKGRFVRVHAANVGTCPDWHIAKGEPAWLFADEIVVE